MADYVPFYQGVGREYVDMWDGKWQTLWEQRAADTLPKPWAFVTICSHAKPYSKSAIHMGLRNFLHSHAVLHNVEYVHMSNAGIVPQALEMTPPFNAYDWDARYATDDDLAYHQERLTSRFVEWFSAYKPPKQRVVVYLRNGGPHLAAVREAVGVLREDQCMQLRVVPAYTHAGTGFPHAAMPDPDDCLLSPTNLASLAQELEQL